MSTGTHDCLVIWWLEPLIFGVRRQNLLCYWIITTMIAVLNVLLGELILRWEFVSVRAFVSTLAVALDKERTYMGAVSFIVRIRSG